MGIISKNSLSGFDKNKKHFHNISKITIQPISTFGACLSLLLASMSCFIDIVILSRKSFEVFVSRIMSEFHNLFANCCGAFGIIKLICDSLVDGVKFAEKILDLVSLLLWTFMFQFTRR
jgi:hypothetical protein